jgi:hypothetical protein
MKEPNEPDKSGDPNWQDAWIKAKHFFWCNTARDIGPGGNMLETRMRQRNFAAAWTSGDFGRFNYPSHMKRVQCGDVIFMYASEYGMIAVGMATARVSILGPFEPDRLRNFALEGNNEREYRIPVKWLRWHTDNPCKVFPPLEPRRFNVSFKEITDVGELLQILWQHESQMAVTKESAPAQQETPEEWAKRLTAWAESHPVRSIDLDDSRESIYSGRGE